MSNVIKAYSVRYDDEAKKTIGTYQQTLKEIQLKQIPKPVEQEPQEGFVEGLKAVVVEAVPPPEETNEKASKIIEKANQEAKTIIEQAKKEAEQLKNDTITAAKKKGYEEGLQQSKNETQKLKAEYEDKAQKIKRQYEEMALSMEPQMAQIITLLVEKITGILVQDKEEVILYLIHKAIKNMDRSNEYTIRVSKEDYEYVSERKNILSSALGAEANIYITEDASLTKNQCLIETDLKVINCSLDIQLNNLIADLRLIGGI